MTICVYCAADVCISGVTTSLMTMVSTLRSLSAVKLVHNGPRGSLVTKHIMGHISDIVLIDRCALLCRPSPWLEATFEH